MAEIGLSAELSDEQLATHNLLERLLGTAVAHRYRDFCVLATGALDLRVTRPLAGHALREFESTLREALLVPMEAASPADVTNEGELAAAKKALRAIGFENEAIGRALRELK